MDDKDLFKFVLAFLIAYITVVILDNATKIYKWLKDRNAGEEPVEDFADGIIPRDYSQKVRRAQQAANARYTASPLAADLEIDERYTLSDLERMRERVSIVRHKGYLAGEDDLRSGLTLSTGILMHPYVTGSGAAQQWVRGYCQGACLAPKKWVDAA